MKRLSHRAITARSRPGRAALTAVVLLASLAAMPLRAQAVVGFGDDATTLPAGMVRLGFLNEWMRFDQRFTSPDGARTEANARIRRTPIALELGVLSRLTVGAMVPSVGTYTVATYFPSNAAPGRADSLRLFGQSAVGDVETWAKLVWLGHQSEHDRTQPTGVHVRSALTGLVRLGTATPAHASQQLAIGTGDDQTDIEAASQWDFIFGRRFWMSLVGRYVRQLPTTRVVRVAPRDDPFASAELVNARIEPGNYYELEATPRLSLGQHFMVGASYMHRHDAATTYTAASGGAQPAATDPSILDVASSSATVYGFGVVYSSVASYVAGRTSIPVEVTLRYFHTDRWLAGVPPSVLAEPERSTIAIGLRLYARLWGKR
ncbi:MAG TPA: hypothetical protein VFK04_02595 [Gemmatimonadaceae bacterium]|nr:hypothetical protein [Gemmatimonadaceae bacterium]